MIHINDIKEKEHRTKRNDKQLTGNKIQKLIFSKITKIIKYQSEVKKL